MTFCLGGQAGGVLERDSALPPEARGGRWPCPKRCPSHRAGSCRRCTERGVGLTAGHGPLVGAPGREASWRWASGEEAWRFCTTVMTPLSKTLSSNGQQARGQPGELPRYPREGALPGPPVALEATGPPLPSPQRCQRRMGGGCGKPSWENGGWVGWSQKGVSDGQVPPQHAPVGPLPWPLEVGPGGAHSELTQLAGVGGWGAKGRSPERGVLPRRSECPPEQGRQSFPQERPSLGQPQEEGTAEPQCRLRTLSWVLSCFYL